MHTQIASLDQHQKILPAGWLGHRKQLATTHKINPNFMEFYGRLSSLILSKIHGRL
jgi:hypothetical protein